MIWIFDLDETLYDESTYVISGLEFVAQKISSEFMLNTVEILKCMETELISKGRSEVFQKLLRNFPTITYSVEELISFYRDHKPNIKLLPDAKELLDKLVDEEVYLVTDGSRVTQRNKIAALKIEENFREIFVTDEHGEGASKPSTTCFKKIKNQALAEWNEMVYIGDDPNKDFINLKPLGMRTIRVNRGRFANILLSEEYEAELLISSLKEVIFY